MQHRESQEPMNERQKILLVDDDKSLIQTLGDLLRFSGYDVIPALDGDEALRKLSTQRPDLIILDISMPKMGGVQFLKALKAETPARRPPVLVFTARSNMKQFFDGIQVAGFLPKTAEPSLLLDEVRRILNTPTESHVNAPRILLAEDDSNLAEDIKVALLQAGCRVEHVATGPRALERSVASTPDVLVLSRVLSEMNGDRVAALLAEIPTRRQTAVILYDSTVNISPSVHRPGVTQFVATGSASKIVAAVLAALRTRPPSG
jgi:DNA-binding response OmpR family regulator